MNKLQFQEKMDSQLPTAQTCFFDLYLPSYSTEKIMKARLLCAISLESFDNSEDKDVVDVENVENVETKRNDTDQGDRDLDRDQKEIRKR